MMIVRVIATSFGIFNHKKLGTIHQRHPLGMKMNSGHILTNEILVPFRVPVF